MKTKNPTAPAARGRKGPTTHGQRPGGRSQRVVADVLGAAATELARGGYASFRVEDVAAAAGVNKTTIYRRWPTKADLVCAAIRKIVAHRQGQADTGSVEGDLLALLQRVAAWKPTIEAATILRMLVLEAAEPEVERIARTLRAEGFEPWLAIVDRAKARGEIPAGADARLLIEMVVAPAMLRLHRLHEPINKPTLAVIVRIVLAGVRATMKT
jgi:AcrR family transcriptional regulator